jgi:hypothetical protein
MIVIDIEADLNVVDDQGRNVARLPAGRAHLEPGSIAVAGRPGFWSWVEIDEIDSELVHFRQISAQQAAARGPLEVLPHR